MEINPYESRLRMLQQFDGVQMQREAAPDEETAGCPGCPYFWTCPVPHQGETVRAPQEIEIEDVPGELSPRRAYRPRDESDIGWLDDWDDEDGRDDGYDGYDGADVDWPGDDEAASAPGSEAPVDSGDDRDDASGGDGAGGDDSGGDGADGDEDTPVGDDEVTRPRGWWNPFRRRR